MADLIMGRDVLEETENLQEELYTLSLAHKECLAFLRNSSVDLADHPHKDLLVEIAESNDRKLSKRINEVRVALRFRGLE